ncbi:MAG: protein kinase [Planctomycetes bacterium]|nr:protein kinase [Planctomycetota bacterium]
MPQPDSTSPPPESQPGLPHRILSGDLELLEELGTGASGTVYRARTRVPMEDLPAGSEVAVKFLRSDLLSDRAAREQLEQEGILGLQLRSPHVVRIYTVETVEVLGLPVSYLVMEYVRGRTLRAFLQESGPAVEDLARRIGRDVALALADLSRLGIVHRDIKPENLVLTPEGNVKLMDLGLARVVPATGTHSSGGFFGSLAYAAPELLRGKTATHQSDLYALGIVLYEVVCGRHPFAQDPHDADELLRRHLEVEPPRPSHLLPRITAFLEHIILDLLAKDPRQRPRSAAELALTLERGESSPWWKRHERQAPVLASRRRLRALRRFAPTPFLGRADEQRRLDEILAGVVAGKGTAVRVSGPEGIGRRRLLDEVVDRWLHEREDLLFLGGEAGHGTARSAGAPFTDLVRDWFLRDDRPDSPRVQERLTARIRAESGLDAREAALLAAIVRGDDQAGPPEVRADLLARVLRGLPGKDRRLLLRVDRPERLDTTGQRVLQRLMDRIEESPLLLLLVAGPDQSEQPFPHHSLVVVGLAQAAFVEFGTRLFAEGQAPEAMLVTAHGVLGGSPGNLLEALDSLVQQGRLSGQPGAYRDLREVDEIPPAGPLLARIRDRVKRLAPGQRSALQAAAILGDSFPLADLVALTGQQELSVLEALSAFQGRFVRAERGRAWFRHRDYRLPFLESMAIEERRELHRRAAGIVAAHGAGPLETGLHLSRAMEHAACLDPLLAALAELNRAGSRQRSLRVAERLRLHLNALPRSREHLVRRLRYQLLAGEAFIRADASASARRVYTQARHLARYLRDPGGEAEAWYGLAGIDQGAGRFRPALALLGRAEALLQEPGDEAMRLLRAKVVDLHARIMGYLGRSMAALELLREALRLLPRSESLFRPHLYIDIARVEALRGHFLDALKALDRADKLFSAADDSIGLMRLCLHRGRVLAGLGDIDEARRELEDALQRAERLANTRVQARSRLYLGELHATLGQRDEAVAHLAAAGSLARRMGDTITHVQAMVGMYAFGHDTPGLEAEVLGLELPFLGVQWFLLRASQELEAGERERAAALLQRAADLDREATLPLPLQLRLWVARGERARAERAIQSAATRLPQGSLRRRFVAQAGALLR